MLDIEIYNFKQTVDYVNNGYLKTFYLYVKNILTNELIPLDKRIEMFLYVESLLPINEQFMWLDYDYVLDSEIYKEILHFESCVLFKDLIPLLSTFTNEYPFIHNDDVNKLTNVMLEKMIRSGYRGFIIN
jgi:hypothetical protein